jgi:FkbH-like protein
MNAVKQLIEENRHEDALRLLLDHARRTTDYSKYNALCRLRRKLDIELPEDLKAAKLRVSLLGSATTDFLEDPLKLELETQGLECELQSSAYNTFASEMLDPQSETVSFNPDIVIFVTTPFSIGTWPSTGDSANDVQSMANSVCDNWLRLCESLHTNTNAEIIINNLHMTGARPAGSLGCRLAWDKNSFLRQINLCLADKAPDYIHILDADMLSAIYGISNWFDIRFWHHSKQPVSFSCIVPFIRNLSAIIGSLYGRTCKCIALDLDNTIWGGVVGDDGVEGIKIGEGDAISESFKHFQKYLLGLKERGVLLAVCSKNEEANALAPFSQLPDMVLKYDDFVAFKANWEPKPENLKSIASELNIGLDSLLFIDDNPAEREHVRQSLSQVKVLELSDDPAEYTTLLDQCGWLEPVTLTGEDIEKTDQYLKNTQRKALESEVVDYDSYLESLEQRAIIKTFDPDQLDRITQLINKTNQFNLTTKRLNRSEVQALMDNPECILASVRLIDRFGDNGLISVLAGHHQDTTFHIDLWLMSCRVFKRGVEYLLANHLFEKLKAMRIETVKGVYIPTPKNQIVKNLYADLGFSHQDASDDGIATWTIEVSDYLPTKVFIDLLEES